MSFLPETLATLYLGDTTISTNLSTYQKTLATLNLKELKHTWTTCVLKALHFEKFQIL